jgi:hypothetical protein
MKPIDDSFPLFLKTLLLCLLSSFHFASGQTPRIDSLLNVLKIVKEDTTKANTLREICDAYKTELNDMAKVGEYAIQPTEHLLKVSGIGEKEITPWR